MGVVGHVVPEQVQGGPQAAGAGARQPQAEDLGPVRRADALRGPGDVAEGEWGLGRQPHRLHLAQGCLRKSFDVTLQVTAWGVVGDMRPRVGDGGAGDVEVGPVAPPRDGRGEDGPARGRRPSGAPSRTTWSTRS